MNDIHDHQKINEEKDSEKRETIVNQAITASETAKPADESEKNEQKVNKEEPTVSPSVSNTDTSPKGNVSDQNTATEIILEQVNQSGSAENQTNTANLFLKKEQPGDINISILHSNISDGQKLSFYELQNLDYKNRLTPEELSYISKSIGDLKKGLDDSRIAVINNGLVRDDLAMSAVEALIFNKNMLDGSRLYSCVVEQSGVNAEYIISQFKRQKSHKEKKSKKSGSVIITIYDRCDYGVQSGEFMKSLVGSSGIADTVTNALRTANLYFIYICNDTALYKQTTIEQRRFSLLNISELHLYLYAGLPDLVSFRRIMRKVEMALSEYGWLSKLNLKEQKEKISELIRAGMLETELEKRIKSMDIEEAKRVTDMASSPLNSMVLFATAFFEGISIIEFNTLIKSLVYGQERSESDERVGLINKDHKDLWETGADDVLAGCGIIRQVIGSGFSMYQFESRSRKDNTIKIFSERYSLKLINWFEIIEGAFLFMAKPISKAFMEGIAALAFVNASNDRERYLSSVCIGITDRITNSQGTDQEQRILFDRLLFLVKKWTDYTEYTPYISRYYHQMMVSPFRRSIMAALLTYICYPERPEAINYLKILLDGSGDAEFFIKEKITQIIALNYGDQMPQLFQTIHKWGENIDSGNLSHSFCFAKSSIFFSFYEKRFVVAKEEDPGYRILRVFVSDLSNKQFDNLISFVFSNKSKEVFQETFKKVIKEQLQSEKAFPKVLSETMFLMYAFILIQWHYLLSIIKTEDGVSALDLEEYMKRTLTLVIQEYGRTGIQIALLKAVNKFNDVIIKQNGITDEIKKRILVLKSKRDGARTLLKTLENIA